MGSGLRGLAALISDESAFEVCARKCAIQIDGLTFLPLERTHCTKLLFYLVSVYLLNLWITLKQFKIQTVFPTV